MASSYSTDLKLELQVTGENAGTWGDITNTNLNLVQQAIAGFESISIAGAAQTTTLLMSNAALSQARNAVIKLTGVITGNQIVTVPTGIEKTYIVQNGTTGAFTVQFIQAGGTGTTFSTTDKGIKILFADGTNINAVDLDTLSGTVATAQIEDDAVTTAKIVNDAVTTAKIVDDAVTSAKIADNAIITALISANQVTTAKIADDAVTADKLADTAVTPASYTAASITVDAQGRITAASSGSAGAGMGIPTLASFGPASGTYTAPGNANRIGVYAIGGVGGGGAYFSCGRQGVIGAPGGFGFFNIPVAQPYSVPYAIAGGGNSPPGNQAGTGNAGGTTTFGPTVTANGGSAGTQPGNTGPAGNAPGASLAYPNITFVTGYSSNNSGGNPGTGGYLAVFENTGT